jgi:hypothetical protein
MAVKKKPALQMEEAKSLSGEPMVDFRNDASWSGERFSFLPGQVITLPKAIAEARQAACLGEIILGE